MDDAQSQSRTTHSGQKKGAFPLVLKTESLYFEYKLPSPRPTINNNNINHNQKPIPQIKRGESLYFERTVPARRHFKIDYHQPLANAGANSDQASHNHTPRKLVKSFSIDHETPLSLADQGQPTSRPRALSIGDTLSIASQDKPRLKKKNSDQKQVHKNEDHHQKQVHKNDHEKQVHKNDHEKQVHKNEDNHQKQAHKNENNHQKQVHKNDHEKQVHKNEDNHQKQAHKIGDHHQNSALKKKAKKKFKRSLSHGLSEATNTAPPRGLRRSTSHGLVPQVASPPSVSTSLHPKRDSHRQFKRSTSHGLENDTGSVRSQDNRNRSTDKQFRRTFERLQSESVLSVVIEANEAPVQILETKRKPAPQKRKNNPTSARRVFQTRKEMTIKEQDLEKPSSRKGEYLAATVGGMGLIASVSEDEKAKQVKEMIFSPKAEVKLKAAAQRNKGPRLMVVKGRKNIQVRQVECSVDSLDQAYSYVLDPNISGNELYQWSGRFVNRILKAKGLDIARRINTKEKGTRATIIPLDEKEDTDNNPKFWKLLVEPSQEPVRPENLKNSAKKSSKSGFLIESEDQSYNDILYSVVKKDSALGLKEIHKVFNNIASTTVFQQNQLLPQHVYILDAQDENVYVWMGRKSSPKDRKFGLEQAGLLLEGRDVQNQDLTFCHVVKESDGAESILFAQKFFDFKGELPVQKVMEVAQSVIAAAKEQTFSVTQMYQTPEYTEKDMKDPGVDFTRKKIWVSRENKKEDYPEEMFGQFFAADSLIIEYIYKMKEVLYEGSESGQQRKDVTLTYFWQGESATVKEKGQNAMLTVNWGEKQEENKENVGQIRVPMYKETQHFLRLFGGAMILHSGKFTEFSTENSHLYQIRVFVRGNEDPEFDIKAIEQPCNAENVNANYLNVLISQQTAMIWIPKNFVGEPEKLLQPFLASKFMASLKSVEYVKQDEEPEQFWSKLGGKNSIFSTLYPANFPKLFHCQHETGAFECPQITHISFEDLKENSKDCFILDTFYNVFVWKGAHCDEFKFIKAMQVAHEYLKSYPLQGGNHNNNSDDLNNNNNENTKTEKPRFETTQIYKVSQHAEPSEFRACFPTWADRKSEKITEISELPQVVDLLKELDRTYTYAELTDKTNRPKGLTKPLETYLSDEEFQQVLGMTKKEWNGQRAWKQTKIRKEKNLF